MFTYLPIVLALTKNGTYHWYTNRTYKATALTSSTFNSISMAIINLIRHLKTFINQLVRIFAKNRLIFPAMAFFVVNSTAPLIFRLKTNRVGSNHNSLPCQD